MAVSESRITPRSVTDTLRGRSANIRQATMYRVDAHADALLGPPKTDLEQPLVNHNAYFRLPQGTELEVVRQEDLDTTYRNIYYTDRRGVRFVYRSEVRNDTTTASIIASTGGVRDVRQIEGRTLIKIMRQAERVRKKSAKGKEVALFISEKQPTEPALAA